MDQPLLMARLSVLIHFYDKFKYPKEKGSKRKEVVRITPMSPSLALLWMDITAHHHDNVPMSL